MQQLDVGSKVVILGCGVGGFNTRVNKDTETTALTCIISRRKKQK